MSQYTEFVPVRVSKTQKARLERLARHDSRNLSDQVRRLIDVAYDETFPPPPPDVLTLFEAYCDVCQGTRQFAWQAHWEAEGMVIELYNCPSCGATKSLKTLRELKRQGARVPG